MEIEETENYIIQKHYIIKLYNTYLNNTYWNNILKYTNRWNKKFDKTETDIHIYLNNISIQNITILPSYSSECSMKWNVKVRYIIIYGIHNYIYRWNTY